MKKNDNSAVKYNIEKTSLYAILFIVFIIGLSFSFFFNSEVINFEMKEKKSKDNFGLISISDKFKSSSVSEEYRLLRDEKTLSDFKLSDGTIFYFDKLNVFASRNENKRGDPNNLLKYISYKVQVGLDKNDYINLLTFDIINGHYSKVFNTIKEKKLKNISSSVSLDDTYSLKEYEYYNFKKKYNYVLKYIDEKNPNTIIALSFNHEEMIDVVSENLNKKEIDIPLEGINELSIMFYNKNKEKNNSKEDLLF